MKGYEGLEQPFIVLIFCISVSYTVFMKGEGLTSEFIGIYIDNVRL